MGGGQAHAALESTIVNGAHDFLWGVSASAFQIEGAADLREPSVWDAFTARRDRIKDGSNASVATDHYHRYREDVALMRELGVGAYRFSVSWPRVLSGDLDFYERLVDELLAAGITPVPTLYHWDTPVELDWVDRDTAFRLADYASVVGAKLADRVPMWITINEPAEVTLLGYGLGQHAPGKQLLFDALPVAHHQLLAHGLAVQALRAAGAGNIGIAVSHTPVWTAGDTQADRDSAGLYDLLMNWLFADPLLLGRYPEGFEQGEPGDMEIISSPLDWYGINYYSPTLVGAPGDGVESFSGFDLPADLPFGIREIEGYPLTGFGWPVVPDGLHEMITQLRDRYGEHLPPIYVTENGCAYPDAVEDSRRIEFLDGHVKALRRAMSEGADVRGYFVWSIMDNFEWIEGYTQRFGLVHVDFDTLRRTPKSSYFWYRDLIRGA
ncbi:GH1 family beta-glucosidase [Nonomuraea sediminis]|uniref:GH1 family beta-glucosidase n=1 Tax=Nonomuraea sediminis TaxID=2835864 RepID=UPI001BDD5ED1|nr:GH1 family beta-glucosidase [Nonomuraea sediminis]